MTSVSGRVLMWHVLLPVAAAALLLPAAAAAQDRPGELPGEVRTAGPSPEEAEALEYLNRLRADPLGEALLIESLNAREMDLPEYVDLSLFFEELRVAEPVPPLVFDPALIEAARAHSRYMSLHGQGHDEEPGLEHYTGRRYTHRIEAAGYDAYLTGENVFVAALGALQGHVAFTIDWGLEDHPGGMQPGRGHRANLLSPRFRQVGIGQVEWHEREFDRDLVSVTHAYGTSRLGRRCIGGVVYTDRNRNGRFDAGEGEPNVTVSASDGSEGVTWDSGAYTLMLAGDGAVSVTVDKGPLARTFEIPAGEENVKRDWSMPARMQRDAVRRALQAVLTAEGGDAARLARVRLGLWLTIQDYEVPEHMAESVAEQTAGIGDAIASSRQLVLDALAQPGGLAAARDLIQSERRAYAGTPLGDWYGEAEVARRVMEVAGRRAGELSEDADPDRRRRALRALYEQLEGVVSPELRAVALSALRP